jgi:DNA-binding response OmpR family regulator
MTVLVVEDDPDQLIVRCMLISHHGFETTPAADANSAMRLAASRHFDFAVIDIHLPSLQSGLSLLADLKAAHSGIGLIVLTGTDPAKLAHYPEMKLADEVIVKGSSAKALLAGLVRLSGRRAP